MSPTAFKNFPPITTTDPKICVVAIGLLLILVALLTKGHETTLRFRADPTIIDVTFNPAQVSVQDVKRWMQLADFISNENGYQVPVYRTVYS